MPTLTFTVGKEYGRTTGHLPVNATFCGESEEDDHPAHEVIGLNWIRPAPNRENAMEYPLIFPPGENIDVVMAQGSAPVNGLSFHQFNQGTTNRTVSAIGIPLEIWSGNQWSIESICHYKNKRTSHRDVFDVVFIASQDYEQSHGPESIGPGHWHPTKSDYERLVARVVALEVERDLRKGAAAGTS